MNIDKEIIDCLFGSWCGSYDRVDYGNMTVTFGYVT
jgi:hypothetical protein